MSPTKIKAFFLNLYPELARFPVFAEIAAVSHTLAPVYGPRLKKTLRYGLPLATLLFVLSLGITIGSILLPLFRPPSVAPAPIIISTPTAVPTYQSVYLPVRQGIDEFNPQLPDPLPPVFDTKISLEPLPQ